MSHGHIEADLDKCMGVGVCQSEAPALFEVGEDGYVHVLTDPTDPDQLDAARRAVRLCPSQALTLREG